MIFIKTLLTCAAFTLSIPAVLANNKQAEECGFIGTNESRRVIEIAIDTNDVVYTLIDTGVCKSVDGGQSWQYLAADIKGGFYRTITTDSNNHIYLGKENGKGKNLFKSTDGGISWKDISDASMMYSVDALAVDSLGQIFSVVSTGGLYDVAISRDAGQSWGYVYDLSADAISVDFADNIYIWSDLFQRSGDGGHTWYTLPKPHPYGWFLYAAFNAENHIFVGDADYASPEGLFRSTDGGQSWEYVFHHRGYAVTSIAIDNSANHIYVSTDNFESEINVFKSSDNGDTWIPLEIPKAHHINDLAVDSKGHIYLGAFDDYTNTSFFFKSENGGASWKALGGQ